MLPYDQIELIIELLKKLKPVRSARYPYTLLLIEGSDRGDADELLTDEFDLDVIRIGSHNPETINSKLKDYAASRFTFDKIRLKIENTELIPNGVDVIVVGTGVTGLYAANKLLENNISFCVVDKRDCVGGIWSKYANATSQVNTSEGAYRLIEQKTRSNSDHSTTREILEDIARISKNVSDKLFLNTRLDWIQKVDDRYDISVTKNGEKIGLSSKGVILAINDRVGKPRKIA